MGYDQYTDNRGKCCFRPSEALSMEIRGYFFKPFVRSLFLSIERIMQVVDIIGIIGMFEINRLFHIMQLVGSAT